MVLDELSESQLIMLSIKGSLNWLFISLRLLSVSLSGLGHERTDSTSSNTVQYKFLGWQSNVVQHHVDCEQSLSSPNFSEVGELASDSLSPIPLSFLPLFCIIYSFPLARRI